MSLKSPHSVISPASAPDIHRHMEEDDEEEDADTASQRSIPLGSPPTTVLDKLHFAHSSPLALRHSHLTDFGTSRRESNTSTLYTDLNSEADAYSIFRPPDDGDCSPDTSVAPSVIEEEKDNFFVSSMTYPPPAVHRNIDDRASVTSCGSASSRKARPESLLVNLQDLPLILGIALVDFNHLIGPRIEYSKGEILEDEEVAKILPFLALPDGAHLNNEDYSYFHLVPRGLNPTTVFGISCNQQISASSLLVKGENVTRSIVQKAVVVLASKPIFGPIRAKLGVVTTALFNQRDFTDHSILEDFASSLELSVRSQLTESGLYMGTSIRELVHTFRQKTLVLVKALMLQKRIMFYGHPVERLCTYQYSLVSLIPGLLQTLDDCGSPPLSVRAQKLERASSLRTSDPKSVMAYMGLPLDLFGLDAFFQPYLPLQQLDVLKETRSWLCGCTNSILASMKEADLLVNIETGTFEFRDTKLERSAGLTAADRKWMDDIIQDVNEGWGEGKDDSRMNLAFKGSDDYLRSKFEEYVYAVLASVRYQEFVAKGNENGVIIAGGAGQVAGVNAIFKELKGSPSGNDTKSTEDFNPYWIAEFKKTNAYEVWERVTDPVLFDIIEARHPCTEKPSVVEDIGIRLQEGIQDLRLEQQLAPAREAIYRAVEGVRGRWSWSSGHAQGLGQGDETGKQKHMSAVVPKASGLRAFSRLGGQRSPPTQLNNKNANLSEDDGDSVVVSQQAPASNPSSPLSGLAGPAKWGLSGVGAFFSAKLAKRDSSSSVMTVESTASLARSTVAARETGGGSPASPLVSVVDMPLTEEEEVEEEGTDVEMDGSEEVVEREVPASGKKSPGLRSSWSTVSPEVVNATLTTPEVGLEGSMSRTSSPSFSQSDVEENAGERKAEEDEVGEVAEDEGEFEGDEHEREHFRYSRGGDEEEDDEEEEAYTGMAL